jgi:hypothetical protein
MVLRKTLFLFSAILLLKSQLIFSQQKTADISGFDKVSVLTESFDNNSNNWITDNNYVSGKVNNGTYILTCKNYQNATGLSPLAVNLDYSKDFEIETSFKIIKGTGGLMFGMTGKYDHYRVEMTNNRDLLVVKNTISKNKLEKIFTSSANSFINSGSSNKITVRKFGGTYSIYLNDNLVKEFTNIKPEGTEVGFNVGINSEISVDYLNVTYLRAKSAPIMAEKETLKKEPVQDPSLNKNVAALAGGAAIIASNSVEPEITWTSPASARTQYDSYNARVKATIKSESELTSVVFYVNGSPKGEAERRIVAGEQGKYAIEKTINLDPGENVVYFLATIQNGSSKKSDNRIFIIPEATKPVVLWNMPSVTNVSVNSEKLDIEVCISSPSGLKSVKVLVNGENMGGDNVFKVTNIENCNIKWQYPVFLKEGVDNSIVVIAENNAGSTPSESRIVRYSRAIAEKRIALVIGNSNYGTKTPLKNPIPDANLMEATLKNLGFTVLKYIDLDFSNMKAAIRDFSQKMKENNVALFYYAGHGVQVEGQNFLIPVDAKLATKDDCKWEAFAVNDIMEEFEKNPKNINIAILDACRNNPFQSWSRGTEAAFTPLTNTSGTFVSFATAPGSTAADGTTGNGLFTEELVKQMNIPQPISSVFLNTRVNVWSRSKQTQRPQEWNDLNGEFYFKK